MSKLPPKKNLIKQDLGKTNPLQRDLLKKDLLKKGLKVTSRRMEILLFMQSLNQPLSVEEIHEGVSRNLKHRSLEDTLDLTTVYRNLKQLTETGIVQKSFFDEGRIQYALGDSLVKSHGHHIQCTECSRIESVDICLSAKHTQKFAELGYQSVSHRLEFYGICSDCFSASCSASSSNISAQSSSGSSSGRQKLTD